MAARTSNSAGSGKSKSTAAKSSARGAVATSTRKKIGTSDTTTLTETSIPDLNTKPATGRRKRTAPSEKIERPESETAPSVDTPESGEPEAEQLPYTYVVSVFKIGAGDSAVERALVEMPAELAFQIARADRDNPLVAVVLRGVYRDLSKIAVLAPELAESALAGTAIRMASELENPYNSATSKSMCARALIETMEQIRSLAPDGEEEGDELDALLGLADATGTQLTVVK